MAETTPNTQLRALALGAALPLGWVAHDLFVFATSGRPAHAGTLAPDALALVILGALWGWIASRSRWVAPLCAVVLAVAVVGLRALPHPFNDLQVVLPRALLLLLLAWAALAWSSARFAWGTARALSLGLLAGLAGCLIVNRERGADQVAWQVVAVASALAVAAWAAPERWRSLRAGVALLSLAAVIAVLLQGARRVSATESRPRPDPLVTRAPAAASGPNLVLIVLDTVRADRFSSYGYARQTTPQLDAFLGPRSTRYTEARSAGSFTFPSHASLFTGLLPSEHGSSFMGGEAQPLGPQETTLAQRLAGAGYQTAAIISNRGYFFPRLGLDRGFAHYDNRAGGSVGEYAALSQYTGRHVPVGHQPYREAAAISDLAGAWLDEEREGGPFFLFLNYMDAHGPTLPPSPFDAMFGGGRAFNPLQPSGPDRSLLYDRALRYMDGEVARVLYKLESDGLLENTLLVVTSDHGHSFGDHDFFGHGRYLFEELVHVPLFIKSPQPAHLAAGRVSDEPITAIEVHDRILRELGLPAAEPPPARGASAPAAPRLRDNFVAEWHHLRGTRRAGWADTDLLCWLRGRRKFIASSAGELQVYDLEQDPREEHPLELDPAEVAAALDLAEQWWTAFPMVEPGVEANVELSAEEADALRALGYTE